MGLGNKSASSGTSGGSSSRGNETNYYDTKKSNAVPRTWFRVLWFLILLSMIAIAFANIRPYVDVAKVLGVTIVDATLIKFISAIPIINAIAASLGIGVVWIIGFALWATFQLIEVMPVILFNHPGFLHEVIQESESHSRYGIKEGDDPTVANLKKAYNKLPVGFLENLSKIRLCAYVIDFCICFWRYSPVESGKITDFFYFVMTGQFAKINGNNMMLALITLFGVEIGLNLLLWVGKLAFTVKKASKSN